MHDETLAPSEFSNFVHFLTSLTWPFRGMDLQNSNIVVLPFNKDIKHKLTKLTSFVFQYLVTYLECDWLPVRI